MDRERFSVYYAIDGPHLDGLIGNAGILRFDWPEREYYIKYFDGVSGAHNPSIAPNGKLALLGNFSQQILLLDVSNPHDMREIARQSAMSIEESRYRLRSNTHHLWYPDCEHFIAAIGDHLYLFDIHDLKNPTNLGPHHLENAHELRWDASHRYIIMGDLGPERQDVRQVAVFDLEEKVPRKRSKIVGVQNNVWHCCVHPEKPVGYALTYSFLTDHDDFIDWSPAYVREYIYEIDLPSAKITRSWSCGAEFPIHLNSDVEVSNDCLYVSSGGNHTVVEIPLENFAGSRVLHVVPPFWIRGLQLRQKLRNVVGGLARKPTITNTHLLVQSFEVSNWRIVDGVYAARVSPQGNYLITGHRGYNVITVYDRKSFSEVYTKLLPFRRDVYHESPFYRLGLRGYHLGLHHSQVVDRQS